jgi:hypothetical protein
MKEVLSLKGGNIMEIIIGSIPPVKLQNQKSMEKNHPLVAAQLLHVRRPRTGIAGPSGRERRTKQAKDPRTGRVLTLMVADASLLPADIESGKYEVAIRFIRR